MLCLKTLRRHWICSIFVFSFFLFFSVFGLSQDSFATSYDCFLSSYSSGLVYPSTVCTDFPSSSEFSTNLYYYDLSLTYTNSTSGRLFMSLRDNSNLTNGSVFITDYNSSLSSLNYSVSGVFFVSNTFYSSFSNVYKSYPLAFSFGNRPSGSTVTNISFKITDDINDLTSSSEPCPVCPEIPDNPYDNKLDDIKKAIYCCGAVLIMLYFFFCIYKIIVKDGGSR